MKEKNRPDLGIDFNAAGFDPQEELRRLALMKDKIYPVFNEDMDVNTISNRTLAAELGQAYADMTAQQVEILKLMGRNR